MSFYKRSHEQRIYRIKNLLNRNRFVYTYRKFYTSKLLIIRLGNSVVLACFVMNRLKSALNLFKNSLVLIDSLLNSFTQLIWMSFPDSRMMFTLIINQLIPAGWLMMKYVVRWLQFSTWSITHLIQIVFGILMQMPFGSLLSIKFLWFATTFWILFDQLKFNLRVLNCSSTMEQLSITN